MCSSDYRGCVHQDNVIKDDRSGSAGPELGTGGGAGGVIVTSCEVCPNLYPAMINHGSKLPPTKYLRCNGDA